MFFSDSSRQPRHGPPYLPPPSIACGRKTCLGLDQSATFPITAGDVSRLLQQLRSFRETDDRSWSRRDSKTAPLSLHRLINTRCVLLEPSPAPAATSCAKRAARRTRAPARTASSARPLARRSNEGPDHAAVDGALRPPILPDADGGPACRAVPRVALDARGALVAELQRHRVDRHLPLRLAVSKVTRTPHRTKAVRTYMLPSPRFRRAPHALAAPPSRCLHPSPRAPCSLPTHSVAPPRRHNAVSPRLPPPLTVPACHQPLCRRRPAAIAA